MLRKLVLFHVSDGSVTQLSQLVSGGLYLGRDPREGGLIIKNAAVSREHGVFAAFGNQWFYTDVGSTNGSWLNGEPVGHWEWRPVRAGDLVQVADMVIQLKASADEDVGDFSEMGGGSLFVFVDGKFKQEFPVTEYGRALAVGGAEGDLQIEGDLSELPGLVIEKRGEDVIAQEIAKERPVLLNGEELVESAVLADGAQIKVADYQIVFSDPGASSKQQMGRGIYIPSEAVEGKTPDQPTLVGVRGWESSSRGERGAGRQSRTRKGTLFGQRVESEFDKDETFALDLSGPNFNAYELQVGRRSEAWQIPQRAQGSSAEDRIILAIVVFLVLVLLGFILWLVSFS